jgi:hypothetical protein
LERGAFSDKGVALAAQKIVPILVDCNWGKSYKDISGRYGIRGYPTVVFADPEGNEIGRMRARKPEAIIKQIESVAGRFPGGPAWIESIDEALKEAAKSSKPVLILTGDGEKAMQSTQKAFSDPTLAELRGKFVLVRSQCPLECDDCCHVEIKDLNGKQLSADKGMLDADALRKMMEAALKAMKESEPGAHDRGQPAENQISTEERPVDKISENVRIQSCNIEFPPDGRRVAYLGYVTDTQWIAVIDGQASERYEADALRPEFSPDSKRVAYVARKDGRSFLVVDSKNQQGFDAILVNSGEKVFSPDSRHVAYIASRDNQLCVVLDGVPSGLFKYVYSLDFIDGKNIAYSVDSDGKTALILPGRTLEKYDLQHSPVFASDGRLVAYVARQGQKRFVVTGIDEGEPFDWIEELRASGDGSCVAYRGAQGGKQFAVVGNKKGKPFDKVEWLMLGPDGRTAAYRAQKGAHWVIVVGETESEEFERVSPPYFSPDGKRVAYSARMKTGSSCLVIDGKNKVEECEYVSEIIAWSPDGRQLVYTMHKDGKTFLVVGNRKVELAVDEILRGPVFSGNKICLGARIGRELWWKVIDAR